MQSLPPPPPLLPPLPSFVINPLNIFMVQGLNAQPSQLNTRIILMTVPWSFKLVYGFLSDVFPIGGLRRKPYLIIGYMVSSLCYLELALKPEVCFVFVRCLSLASLVWFGFALVFLFFIHLWCSGVVAFFWFTYVYIYICSLILIPAAFFFSMPRVSVWSCYGLVMVLP